MSRMFWGLPSNSRIRSRYHGTEQKRLEAADVRFVRPATREPWGGLVATFMDLDGNYCQLVQAS